MKIAHPLSLEVNPYQSSLSLGDVSPRSCHDRAASTTTTTGKREEETTHTAQGGKGKQFSPPPQNKSVIDWQRTYLKRTWGCSAAVMAESGVLLTFIFKRNTDFLFLFQVFPAFAAINHFCSACVGISETQPLWLTFGSFLRRCRPINFVWTRHHLHPAMSLTRHRVSAVGWGFWAKIFMDILERFNREIYER